jgi:hypothetical protein
MTRPCAPRRTPEVSEPSGWALQFSCPIGADDRVLDAVVGTQAQALAQSLVATCGDEIAACGEGVAEVILDWSRTPPSYEAGWDIAFGRAQLALSSAALNPAEVASRLALRLTEIGWAGEWQARIVPSTLRLGGLILPRTERLRVERDGVRAGISVRAQNGGSIECRRAEPTGEWMADGVEKLPSVGFSRSIHLLGASGLPPADGGEQGFEGVVPIESIDPPIIDAFRAALELLATSAGEYGAWIERVLRGVLVSHREQHVRVLSGSGEAAPGVIHASYPASSMEIAEILVHECAHQYFYMLERVGPVDDGSDSRRYWSPPIRLERPLSRILMAYHALANVRLFYESLRGAEIDDGGYVKRNEPEILDAVSQLDEPLQDNRALTPLGRALYEPLADRLAALAG